ncbi:hypothetical protein PARPLA_03103 [Rhodobacteraceae bacterium THAF1]|nr:hypothetical protein FIU81_07425 [Palleronia sp. THAF1]VDC29484.1 hypothetical protein PARPLA_03103 [Rhodobacteraceae bacterium THAF1]
MLRAAIVLATLPLAVPAWAQQQSSLFDVLRLGEVLEIMRDEGVAYGADIDADLLAGQGGAGWEQAVAAIYDTRRMTERMRSDFEDRIDADDAAILTEYFNSDPGAQIVELEVEARRAMTDQDVEDAARDAIEDVDPDRLDQLTRFIEANDLIEQNVSGAMNSNFAFLTGLSDGGAMGGQLTEAQIISDVYAQAPEIRDETTEWLYGYLGLAYAPLDDDVLQDYVDLGETERGQALNAAIFAAFDALYTDISYDLGRAAARFMDGEDI